MRIAITGGAGFVGSHLARAFLDAGHEVLVIDSLVSGMREALDPRARDEQLAPADAGLQPDNGRRPVVFGIELRHHVFDVAELAAV